MEELEILTNKEIRITSIELVEIINQFRKVESEVSGKQYKELTHKNFMAKIRTELETLKMLGLGGELNFKPSSYINKQNKEQPCFSLNSSGMRMMLNSESTIVRYKTEQYIDKLESENNYLKEQISKKALLLEAIYNGGQAGILASKQLSELETAEAIKPLNEKIVADTPFVKLAKERLDKGEKISLTDVTKSLKLKRGQISTWLKINGYIHKTQTEINKKGEDMFKIYKENGFSCIGILEQGIKLINNNIEEIKQSPTKFKMSLVE